MLDDLDARRRARAGHAARARCCRSRPRCSSSRSPPTAPTASASTASRASCTPPPARRSRRAPWERGPRIARARSTAAQVTRRVPRAVPALHRARVRGRHDRALAAVAEGAAAGRRAAPDQQRRRHHQLRDAAHRPAAARLRPRPRRRRAADGAPRARRASRCETLDGQTRTLDGEMVVIDDADGPTSIAGLMGGARSEVQPDTTPRAARGRHLERPQHPPHARGRSGCAARPPARFEKGLQPEQCMQAQAVATQLMIELCGATRRCRARSTSAGATPPAQVIAAARGARAGDPRRARRA